MQTVDLTGTTVRSFSRVMADAVIDQGVRLLEHTLVMAGERVPEGETRQGWPTRVRSAAGAAAGARVGVAARSGTGATQANPLSEGTSKHTTEMGSATRASAGGGPLTGSVVVEV